MMMKSALFAAFLAASVAANKENCNADDGSISTPLDTEPATETSGRRLQRSLSGVDPNTVIPPGNSQFPSPIEGTPIDCEYSCGFFNAWGACENTDNLFVDKGSCMDDQACRSSTGSVGPLSCQGYWSCKDSTLNVGEQSCIGPKTCYKQSSGTTTGNYCCIGENACLGGGGNTFNGFDCWGFNACYRNNDVSMGQNSCQGDTACYEVRSSIIGELACRGQDGCYKTENSIISSYSCWYESACGNSTDLTVKEGSCIGYRACQDTNLTHIGEGSCSSEGAACYGLQEQTIGDNSCNGYKSCSRGRKSTEGEGLKVNIGSGSCNCDRCCSCEFPMGDSRDVPDGMCNDPTECCSGKFVDIPLKTSAPTEAPTKSPTLRPTRAPTASPTEKPTEAPTEGLGGFLLADGSNVCGYTWIGGQQVASKIEVCVKSEVVVGRKKNRRKVETVTNQCRDISGMAQESMTIGASIAEENGLPAGSIVSFSCCEDETADGECISETLKCPSDPCNDAGDIAEGEEVKFGFCVSRKNRPPRRECQSPSFSSSGRVKVQDTCDC